MGTARANGGNGGATTQHVFHQETAGSAQRLVFGPTDHSSAAVRVGQAPHMIDA
jgi:hypothetical protein